MCSSQYCSSQCLQTFQELASNICITSIVRRPGPAPPQARPARPACGSNSNDNTNTNNNNNDNDNNNNNVNVNDNNNAHNNYNQIIMHRTAPGPAGGEGDGADGLPTSRLWLSLGPEAAGGGFNEVRDYLNILVAPPV